MALIYNGGKIWTPNKSCQVESSSTGSSQDAEKDKSCVVWWKAAHCECAGKEDADDGECTFSSKSANGSLVYIIYIFNLYDYTDTSASIPTEAKPINIPAMYPMLGNVAFHSWLQAKSNCIQLWYVRFTYQIWNLQQLHLSNNCWTEYGVVVHPLVAVQEIIAADHTQRVCTFFIISPCTIVMLALIQRFIDYFPRDCIVDPMRVKLGFSCVIVTDGNIAPVYM